MTDTALASRVDLRAALVRAADWTAAAHDATRRNGVSGGLDLRDGWLPPYPETSGYTIPTLLRAAERLDRPDLAERAVQIADWLLEIQLPDGSFPGDMGVHGEPVVFDVGQILLGLVAAWRATGRDVLLVASRRAARWLADELEPDGSWVRHAFLGLPNSYSTRVCWAMAEVCAEVGEPEVRTAVRSALRWVLRHAHPDGWVDHMAFRPGQDPYTHTIAYTLRGLLRCAALLDDDLGRECAEVAVTAASRLAEVSSPLWPLLPGQLAPGFEPAADYACLTGDAQMATVWLDAARHAPHLAERAEATVARLLEVQVDQPLDPRAVGALPGSWPLGGGYEPLRCPNWATKFLADALLNLDDHRSR
ncbi:prenyltransferase/squalene oxidase repeat-containing protein [Saccharothrix obliqua]|uniref:prenyltransferase/squalene oxidase repeat-containing protein n=1 Tax=Saccharothrix obliqua TaxID=2861747 RepID=UPI001C5E62DF|nr:prenyltransferase/squalene oxidase repeat-containing protein [Saccharothrix obliqua]MBW4720416.1 terpene cyclase/mutase family protein [Saccharothrix obliqua]